MLKKKYFFKIPLNLNYIYCTNSNKLVIISSTEKRIINLTFKLLLANKSKNYFYITTGIHDQSLTNKKNYQSLRMLEISKIKKTLIEISTIITKKLKLIGVGYRAFIKKNETGSCFLKLKLGYSHDIFIKIVNTVTIICPKPDIILLSSKSSRDLNQLISLIRSYKIPDSYKGKGILYEYEKLNLKIGKKS